MQSLLKWFENKGSVMIAFSGGVDSSVVAKAAYDVLGDNAMAIIGVSELLPINELKNAKMIAEEIGIKLMIFKHILPKEFHKNSKEKCYYCKKSMMEKILKIAKKEKFNLVVDGTNYDDIFSYRPGIRALKELKIRSPLVELKIRKSKVREIAKKMGLSNYNKPPIACMGIRIFNNK